mmetsp:Transcript_19972/g.42995  ORF Transcript_19972/g.42995 Transcript_19972/m.42995 type:complete len:202 (-) Transcript_19972:1375-1980(-)
MPTEGSQCLNNLDTLYFSGSYSLEQYLPRFSGRPHHVLRQHSVVLRSLVQINISCVVYFVKVFGDVVESRSIDEGFGNLFPREVFQLSFISHEIHCFKSVQQLFCIHFDLLNRTLCQCCIQRDSLICLSLCLICHGKLQEHLASHFRLRTTILSDLLKSRHSCTVRATLHCSSGNRQGLVDHICMIFLTLYFNSHPFTIRS